MWQEVECRCTSSVPHQYWKRRLRVMEKLHPEIAMLVIRLMVTYTRLTTHRALHCCSGVDMATKRAGGLQDGAGGSHTIWRRQEHGRDPGQGA